MDIQAMQNEVYEWAHSKGWEPDPNRTFADECALLHSEVSEALEAYRTWEFKDATKYQRNIVEYRPDATKSGKPEGVGSELADVLVRLCHYSGIREYPVDKDWKLHAKAKSKCTSFGGECTVMHGIISMADAAYDMGDELMVSRSLSALLAMLLYSCELHGLDLEWEYRRKMDYNLTRSYRHGNKVM